MLTSTAGNLGIAAGAALSGLAIAAGWSYGQLPLISAIFNGLDDLEFAPDMRCVAIPVFEKNGEVPGGIAISGPSSRFDMARLGVRASEVQVRVEIALVHVGRALADVSPTADLVSEGGIPVRNAA